MAPPPLTVIPFGLAIIKSVLSPATSIMPLIAEAFLDVTSFRMTFQPGRQITVPLNLTRQNWYFDSVMLLLKISPFLSTFKLS